MKMIWQRVQRVMAARAHTRIDQMEQPGEMMNQLLREQAIAAGEARIAQSRARAWHRTLLEKMTQEEKRIEEFSRIAVQTLEEGCEDMARKAINRKQEAEARLVELRRQVGKAESLAERQKRQVELLRENLEELREKRAWLMLRESFARNVRDAAAGEIEVREPIAMAVTRMEEKTSYMEAEAEAWLDDDMEQDDGMDQYVRNRAVEDELSALKARLQQPETPDQN